MRSSRLLVLVVLAVLAAALAGCTGVPRSSSPAVVRTVPVGGGNEPSDTVTPAPGVLPQSLVENFLEANASDAGRHASARTFLTPAARTRWLDTTVTVVASTSVGSYVAGKRQIVVSGRELGSVSLDGTYTPMLLGSRAASVQFVYGIAKPAGQYRISSLRPGLLLTEVQFLSAFVERNVYFFDLAQHYLVPDARWVSDSDPIQQSELLVNAIAGGPSDSLQNAVVADTLPTQALMEHINVLAAGGVIRIEIPGTAQLDAGSKDRLAAQIATTLADSDRGRALEITDGGSPVTIPDAGGREFSAADFGDTLPIAPIGEVFYLRDGRVVDEHRHRLAGPVNDGQFDLTSIAESRSSPGGSLSIAGVAQVNDSPHLVMGSQADGLKATDVGGVTSRPTFAPGRVEAWVAAGAKVYRATLSGRTVTVASVALPTPVAGEKILALRLSPEGSRIAAVLQNSNGLRALFTGAIVRTGGQVRIDTLQQISPDDVMITDLAWIETERLYAIGYNQPSEEARIYQTGADGSAWSETGIGQLPAPPTTLSVALTEPAWVTSGTSVYVQLGGTSWGNPDGGSDAGGSAPAYVE